MATKKTEPKVKTEPIEEVNAKAEEVEVVTEPVEEKVMVMVPFVEGQDPEVTVIINGEITKFKKGRTVKVSKAVAQVLEQSNQQMMVALENQRKFENPNNQRTDL